MPEAKSETQSPMKPHEHASEFMGYRDAYYLAHDLFMCDPSNEPLAHVMATLCAKMQGHAKALNTLPIADFASAFDHATQIRNSRRSA